MKYRAIALVIALGFSPYAVRADLIARHDGDWVRLSEKPCSHAAVLEHIDPGVRDEFLNAEANIDGRNFLACWIDLAQGAALVYEDGDSGMIPPEDIKPDESL